MRRATTLLLFGQLALCGSIISALPATTLSGGTQVAVAPPAGVANKTLIFVNGKYYQPFSKDLAVGTPVYLDAESGQLRATQRSLGYREVDYKKQFFGALTFAAVTPLLDENSNSIYNYGDLSTSTTLAGYWTKKNLPVILGVDGNGYITDGHHTTAGYLATPGAALIAGFNHIVLGTTVANPSSETAVNAAMWNTFSSTNNAYLYGSAGNQLLLPGDAGYEGLQAIVPSSIAGTAVPIIPGTVSMGNDLYRSLAWAAVDPIVKTATSISGAKLAGYKKVDSTSTSGSQPDVNFVEFYWADFLRNRIVWNDSAAVTSANLINAPVSFFVAAANAIALGKSEAYADQNGRTLSDYAGEIYSSNTRTWARASLLNGMAVAGDTYNVFLSDDASIQGDIIPSGTDGVVNRLYINTCSLITVPGAVRNFTSIAINTGASITIDWKDAAVNNLLQDGVAQNKTLTLAAGSGDVAFSGDNNYSNLASLIVAAGTLTLDTTGASGDSVIWGDISGAGALRKKGTESLTLSGANTFTGGIRLQEGYLTLASTSVVEGGTFKSSPLGLGALTMSEGSGLVFEESALLLNGIRVVSGTGDASGAGVKLSVGENSVELAGSVTSEAPVSISGPATAVIKLSAANKITGTLTLDTLTLRVGNADALSMGTILMQSGATIQAGTSFATSASLVVDGNLDAAESLLEWAGVISGPGKLTISGSNGGAVRLSGLNTYSGGTEVNQSRVEVGVNGSDAETADGDLTGRAFGSGEVVLNSSILGFSVPAVIPNLIRITGASGVDVGPNLGHISGNISGDGSLFVTGDKRGALFLTGNNSYTGQTEVEGTTLRVYSSAGSAVFGDNTLPLLLNDATLQIVPDFLNPVAVSTFGTRGISLGVLGGVLDANDNDLLWEGVISGQGKLTVNAARGNTVELAATNTHAGGTEITGGALLKFSRDGNLGSSAGGIVLNDGGLFYSGSQPLNVSRGLEVRGNSFLDAGSQTLSLSGSVKGSGLLELGNIRTTGGVIVGESFKTFAGTTLLSGGSLSVTHADALKGSTLEVVASGGALQFNTIAANLGGLSGNGALRLPSGFQLTIGESGKSSYFAGSISGVNIALSKLGVGDLSLAGTVSFVTAAVGGGRLVLESSSLFDGATKLTLAQGSSLVVNGSKDLRENFDLTNNLSAISDKALIVFNGAEGAVLTLPKEVWDKVGFVTNGLGQVKTVFGGTVTTVSNSGGKLPAGSIVTAASVTAPTTMADGGKLVVDTSAGAVNVNQFSGMTGGGTSSVIEVASDAAPLVYGGKPNFNAVIDAPVSVPAAGVATVELLQLKGINPLTVEAGGKIKMVASTTFSGTTFLGVGASADLTGSIGSLEKPGMVSLASGAVVNVNPTNSTAVTVVPAFTGEGGNVGLKSGLVVLSGSNENFGGTITVEKGVSVTVRGNLPKGTIAVQDASVPLGVDTSSGNLSLAGTISGSGAVALSGGGRLTMGAGAQIQTAELKLGTTAADKPTLDVSGLSGGLVLTSSQTLSGGGTLTGSLRTNGQFKPGNSPGVFTVAKSAQIGADGTFGGNLLLDSASHTELEYGKRLDNAQYDWDRVVVAGSLSIATGARIVLSPYVGTDSLGVQYISAPLPARLTLTGVFSSASLSLGAVLPELLGAPYIMNVRWMNNGTSLDIVIEKASYGSKVSPAYLKNLGNYLYNASSFANSGLANYLVKLDSSVNQAQLEAGLQALSSPVYSEAQRISLRRTSAVSGALQNRLSVEGGKAPEGWSAFSEAYAWSFHREGSAVFNSWNANTFGEIAGVERSLQGLSFGIFGATGYSTASFTGPASTLKGDSFHGGGFAQINSGSLFVNASFLAGSTEQKATRQVYLGGLGGTMGSRFNTSEYAAHLRVGCMFPNIAGAYQWRPSFALVCNGYSQGGLNETGTDASAAGLSTEKKSANAWQTRFGSDISRAFRLSNVNGLLSTSLHWIHDFDKDARATPTRFQGAGSSAESFNALGSTIGGDAFEAGVSASLEVTSRTTLRASGNWQMRDGSSQPGASFGVGIKF